MFGFIFDRNVSTSVVSGTTAACAIGTSSSAALTEGSIEESTIEKVNSDIFFTTFYDTPIVNFSSQTKHTAVY